MILRYAWKLFIRIIIYFFYNGVFNQLIIRVHVVRMIGKLDKFLKLSLLGWEVNKGPFMLWLSQSLGTKFSFFFYVVITNL